MYRHIRHASKKVYHVLKLTLGAILVIFGVIFLFVPFVPGILFIIPGLILLGFEMKSVKEFFHKVKEKIKTSLGLSKFGFSKKK